MRTFIIFIVTITLASLLASGVKMLLPPDSGGMGHDSYGVQPYGLRGWFESLESLGLEVEHGLIPPPGGLSRDSRSTMVLWNPDARIVHAEPYYLQELGKWIAQGGHVILAPPFESSLFFDPVLQEILEDISDEDQDNTKGRGRVRKEEPETQSLMDTSPLEFLLGGLGLDGLLFKTHRFSQVEELPNIPMSQWKRHLLYNRSVEAKVQGYLAPLAESVQTLMLPYASVQYLAVSTLDGEKDASLAGYVAAVTEDGEELTLVACFHLGQGRVTVVSDPSLFVNSLLAKEDNGVLATSLALSGTDKVVFDEFYHGLSIRGNTLWLLTRSNFANLFAALLVLGLLLIWRQAVLLGPPKPEATGRRRTVSEYVDAMAGLFVRGDCRWFLMQELAAGAMWSMRKRLGLGPGQEKLDVLCKVLARRNARDADLFRKAVEQLDELSQAEKRPRNNAMITSAQEVSKWL